MKKLRRLKTLVNNQQGIALVIAIFVSVVVTIIGIGLQGLTATNSKISKGERDYQSSYYIAESGITHIMNQVNSKVMDIYQNAASDTQFFSDFEKELSVGTETIYNSFEESFGEKPIAKIKIDKVNSNTSSRQYKITSIGTIGNRLRTVEKTFQITWVPKNTNAIIPTNKVVFVKNTIHLSNNATVQGDVGTISTSPNVVILENNSKLKGTVEANSATPIQKSGNADFIGSVKPLSTTSNFIMPKWQFPNFTPIQTDYLVSNNQNKTLIMDTDLSYDQLKVNNNGVLNIQVPGTSKALIVNDFEVENNGKIFISGGKLTVYVLDNLAISNNSQINTTNNINNFQFIVKASTPAKTISFEGAVYGSLFAENANIDISGNTGFQGHILTGGARVDISGNTGVTSRLLYAPNAVVTVSGNSQLKGSIIAQSFVGENNSTITFLPWDSTSIPLPPGNGTGVSVSINDLISSGPTREKK
jgi:Tfp pilus assembly protein PilX